VAGHGEYFQVDSRDRAALLVGDERVAGEAARFGPGAGGQSRQTAEDQRASREHLSSIFPQAGNEQPRFLKDAANVQQLEL
jgi:hypothetical protein